MKKIIVLVICIFALVFSGCGQTLERNDSGIKEVKNLNIELNFAFGEREGKYTGTLEDGLPNGYGVFKSENSSGTKWTYEGQWENGHFEGEGTTVFETGVKEIGIYREDYITPMSPEELKKVYGKPEEYVNRCAEITAKVFSSPDYYEGGVAVQVWEDYKNNDHNTIVYINDDDFIVEEGDYIKAIGIFGEVYEGTNAFGASLTIPTLSTKECSVISYLDTIPILKTVEVNETQTQLGYSVTLIKVEIVEGETRLYLRVENNGETEFSLYTYSAKIVQNGKQYEEQTNYESELPKIQTGLLVGITSEGVVTFPQLEIDDFKIILECGSDNYKEDLDDFVFEVTVGE